MSRKTRAEYEVAVAALQARTDGKLEQSTHRIDVAAPYLYAAFNRSCTLDVDDAAQVGAEMARLASQHLGYLTCHTGGGAMQWSIHFSRALDEQDAVPVAVPAETTERMEAAAP